MVRSESCHVGPTLPARDDVALLTRDFTQTDRIAAMSRGGMTLTNVTKHSFFLPYCLVLADFIVLSNPLKASFATDTKASVTDFISDVSNPPKKIAFSTSK